MSDHDPDARATRAVEAETNPYCKRDDDGRIVLDHEKISAAIKAGLTTRDIMDGKEKL